MPQSDIFINDRLSVPMSDLRFETARSSGPGGQHVNKTESRVTLVFDLDAAVTLSDEMRQRVRECHPNRISKRGQLRVSSQSHRSQKANREETVERFTDLLRDALAPVQERRPTRVPSRARRQRAEDKRRQSSKKALRQKPSADL